MPGDNSIQDNLDHDLNKDYRCTVYLTRPERDALEAYCRQFNLTHSDAAGDFIWKALKMTQFMDPGYFRPTGR